MKRNFKADLLKLFDMGISLDDVPSFGSTRATIRRYYGFWKAERKGMSDEESGVPGPKIEVTEVKKGIPSEDLEELKEALKREILAEFKAMIPKEVVVQKEVIKPEVAKTVVKKDKPEEKDKVIKPEVAKTVVKKDKPEEKDKSWYSIGGLDW